MNTGASEEAKRGTNGRFPTSGSDHHSGLHLVGQLTSACNYLPGKQIALRLFHHFDVQHMQEVQFVTIFPMAGRQRRLRFVGLLLDLSFLEMHY